MAEATRPPERSDLLRLCAELNRIRAKYIVIGGLAMNELGLVRVTEDVDLLIEASPENQQRVREALRILPERAMRIERVVSRDTAPTAAASGHLNVVPDLIACKDFKMVLQRPQCGQKTLVSAPRSSRCTRSSVCGTEA
jgi:hypothetical protein